MKLTEIIVGIATIILLIGVIWLLAIGKGVEIILPILTILVGWLVGRKQDTVAGFFKKKKK